MAHGFSDALLADLVETALVTLHRERVELDQRIVEVVRLRITDEGRKGLEPLPASKPQEGLVRRLMFHLADRALRIGTKGPMVNGRPLTESEMRRLVEYAILAKTGSGMWSRWSAVPSTSAIQSIRPFRRP